MNFLEYYDVTTDGRIFSKRNNRFLKTNQKKNGYVYIELNINGINTWYRVHRLVALVHIPNPLNKPYVNHKNGIKNDNRAENLEWVTGSENNIHAIRNGLAEVKKQTYNIYKNNEFVCSIYGLKETANFINKSTSTTITSKNKPTKEGYMCIPLNV